MEAAGLVAAHAAAQAFPGWSSEASPTSATSSRTTTSDQLASRTAAVVLVDFRPRALHLRARASSADNDAPVPGDEQTLTPNAQLEGAKLRKKRLQAAKTSTTHVDQEILPHCVANFVAVITASRRLKARMTATC